MKSKNTFNNPAHIFSPAPSNSEEAVAYGDALARSGNYPVGTSDCFNVSIAGGCGPNCFVYLESRCEEPHEMLPRLNVDEKEAHLEMYGKE